ncbi:MAG: hypothetical protein LBH07_08535, partial [Treponema sp.]|nr:hypothetical protein [Treponema sp.]
MFFSKLKISTKLIISSAVFLIPIGVMLFFICTITFHIIKKGKGEHDGINSIKPVVTVMQHLPSYLNVYLDLEQGDLRQLDDQITGAIKSLDREMNRYKTAEKELPNLLADWENLKKIEKDDEELYQSYLDFAHSLTELISWVGGRSRLILVSNMGTYYFVAPALTNVPEASIRLMTIGNLLRKNLYDAEHVVDRWNSDLAEAQAQGRRLNARPFDRDPRSITLSMLVSTDLQLIRNSNFLFESDKERISNNLESAMEDNRGREDELAELAKKLGKEADLTITGGDLGCDVEIAAGLAQPLIHILRNCLDHGLEAPEIRAASGKPRRGP